ncbi:MAG: class I fructose-bisphosphate aldolase [Bacteroidetes bacterium QH_9_67_14]|jgi:class I fructose-bisphosphate aldolase|nr:MAG: class I fructose-bisphosphate aldolase [Bacteroidetes bacterium QH_9_67_14]
MPESTATALDRTAHESASSRAEELLGDEAEFLLGHTCETIPKEKLYLPGPDFVDRVWAGSDRNPRVLRSMQALYGHGRLGGSGYVSILPVDQGLEHTAGASFAPNPDYFDPEKIIELAIEGGTNGVATSFGVLGNVARTYAHKIPFILKFNHNELLSYPNFYDQTIFASVEDAFDMGCVGVGATIYFGSGEKSRRQIREVSKAFSKAHDLGMMTILWCYVRNEEFRMNGKNYEASADLTGQANHIGATIEADIVKQKQPTLNGGFEAVHEKTPSSTGGYAKQEPRIYTELSSDHPIDLTRYQVANGYMGRVGLINSGGGSGENDLQQVVRTAVINKRAGGTGLITGRKAFQRPMDEGVDLLHAIQDVYLDDDITVA